MLSIISPAKILNFKPQAEVLPSTQPIFSSQAKELIDVLKNYSSSDIASLMSLNTNQVVENVERYRRWTENPTEVNSKQAVVAYNGEVYKGLQANTLLPDDFAYLQRHLRILSGLYGILRPTDLIQPYRLDVSHKILLDGNQSNDLYPFWEKFVTDHIGKALAESDNPKIVVNLASGEYAKMINFKKLKVKLIDFEFLQYNPQTDRYKTIVIYLKKARGLMLRFITQNRISNPDDLRAFSDDDYWYSPKLSTDTNMVFVR